MKNGSDENDGRNESFSIVLEIYIDTKHKLQIGGFDWKVERDHACGSTWRFYPIQTRKVDKDKKKSDITLITMIMTDLNC